MRPRVDAAQQPRFNRGYTGHEHIASLGLINMNGRLYDPTLQRFLSPDPYLQDPTDPQNHNAYSYCLNNPLMYTDPTGQKISLNGLKKGLSFAQNFAYSLPVAVIDKAKEELGSNVVLNTASNVAEEVYMGRFDPSYYFNRFALNQSQIDASNHSIFGSTYNFASSGCGNIFGYEEYGNKRYRKLYNVTAPANEYEKRPSRFDYNRYGNKYYDFLQTHTNSTDNITNELSGRTFGSYKTMDMSSAYFKGFVADCFGTTLSNEVFLLGGDSHMIDDVTYNLDPKTGLYINSKTGRSTAGIFNGKIGIILSPLAFADEETLFLVLGHELIHAENYHDDAKYMTKIGIY